MIASPGNWKNVFVSRKYYSRLTICAALLQMTAFLTVIFTHKMHDHQIFLEEDKKYSQDNNDPSY